MNGLRFQIEFEMVRNWTDGAGEMLIDDLTLELSAPQTMGDRGVGTNVGDGDLSPFRSCRLGMNIRP